MSQSFSRPGIPFFHASVGVGHVLWPALLITGAIVLVLWLGAVAGLAAG